MSKSKTANECDLPEPGRSCEKMKTSKHKKITFRDGEEEKLHAIAAKLNACFTHGPSAGKPTWRALIHDIIHERLIVTKLQ